MTATEPRPTVPTPLSVPAPIAVDLYRDIHKCIRVDLFDLTSLAGRVDPSDDAARADLAARVRGTVDFLESHAEHEDTAIAPVLEVHLPAVADRVEADHVAFEGRGSYLCDLAQAAADATGADRRVLVHHLYLDLAGFASTYLAHQDLEERQLMPALEAAVGVEQVLAIHQAIVGSIPPDEMAASLARMLPVMNQDDRTEMLGGMQAGAPPEVFAGVWDLAGSVLSPAEHRELGVRLGVG